MRKTILAVAAALALGTATMATGAVAAPPHGGMGHGGPGFGGMGRPGGMGMGRPGGMGMGRPGGMAFGRPGPGGRFAFRGGRRGRFFGPGFGLYAYGGGCWVRRWVWTPFGFRWRLVDVC